MRITIFGYGFVGGAHEMALKVNGLHEVTIVDPKFEAWDVGNPEAIIIAVSTPQGKYGMCDMTNVYAALDECPPNVPILIKSTISLEGWDHICEHYPEHEVTFSPEFLRADHALEDFNNREKMFFGGGDDLFWATLFWKQGCEMFRRDPEELIVMKYTINSFLATKVAFLNQIYDMCQRAGINYDTVKDLIATDERIGQSHLEVTKERGFGGHCFPKDTNALVYSGVKQGVDLSILKSAIDYNDGLKNVKHISYALEGIMKRFERDKN